MHYCALLNRLDVAEFLIRKRSMVDPKDLVYFPVLNIQLLFSIKIIMTQFPIDPEPSKPLFTNELDSDRIDVSAKL